MDVFINRKKLSKGAQVALFELLENFGIRTPRSTVNQMPLLCFENDSKITTGRSSEFSS